MKHKLGPNFGQLAEHLVLVSVQTVGYHRYMVEEDSPGGHPGTLLRQLRYTRGRRISQQTLAILVATSRAHIARLELQGTPVLTEEQLDRLEKAGDVVQPPFSRAEIDELRVAMHTARASAVEQADRALQGIADRANQIFAPADRPGEQGHGDLPETFPDPFAEGSRPSFLTEMSQVLDALQGDVEHLARECRDRRPGRGGAEPDLILAWFERNLVELAEDPEELREAIREVLGRGGTVEVLLAPAAEEEAEDLVALVPPFIAYLGQGGSRFRVHVTDESRHPLAHDICVAGSRGLLIARGRGGRTAAVRTNDRHDVDALRDLLRPHWKDKEPIIEEVGRRTRETVAGHSPQPSVAWPFEQLLTSVEVEEGPRRLVKKGLSILNIPVAIHAWKWRAAELCTAGWIPGDLLEILNVQAWELAEHGLRQLPSAVLDRYTRRRRVHTALEALDKYAQGLHRRQTAWGEQLSRHQFWDACPKSAIRDFIHAGELPSDEIPPACEYRAERGDIETIITRLITRLRSSRNYHLALIDDEQPFPQWSYFWVKGAHVLAQVFGSPHEEEGTDKAAEASDAMLNIHIHSAPIAGAFAGWFDEHVLKTAVHPAWQDNRGVADWLEAELQKHGRSG